MNHSPTLLELYDPKWHDGLRPVPLGFVRLFYALEKRDAWDVYLPSIYARHPAEVVDWIRQNPCPQGWALERFDEIGRAITFLED